MHGVFNYIQKFAIPDILHVRLTRDPKYACKTKVGKKVRTLTGIRTLLRSSASAQGQNARLASTALPGCFLKLATISLST